MIVICKRKMPDGTDIQIEDWRIDYPKIVGYILAAYPESTKNQFMVKAGERQRVSFDFAGEETTKAFFLF